MSTWETAPVSGIDAGITAVAQGITSNINSALLGTDSVNALLSSMVSSAEVTSVITPIVVSPTTTQDQLAYIYAQQNNNVATYTGNITKTIAIPPDSVASSNVGSVTDLTTYTYTAPTPPTVLPLESNFSNPPTRPSIGFNMPSAPSLGAVSASFSSPPASASIGTVTPITLGALPVLSATAPTVRDLTAPSAFNKSVPTGYAIPEHTLPETLTDTFPDVPELHDLTLPTPPTINLVDFAGVLPTPLETPPDVDFDFNEVVYGSPLNTELGNKFINYVMNYESTSQLPAIEQQLWDRTRDDQTKLARKGVANVKRSYAHAGWMQPVGSEMEAVFSVFEDAAVINNEASRKITDEQLKLEQSNFHFNVGKALEYEAQLIELYNAVQQRNLEAAGFIIEAAVGLYEIKVAYLNSNIALYTTQAEVYTTRIQAEINKLEIFKTQLEGLKLIGDINKQDIAVYKARIKALVSMFELYRLELSGVKAHIETDALKVQNYGASIKAFAAEVKAKALEFEGYATALTGEEIKAKIYNSLVSSYSKQVSAYKAEVGAKAKELEADIKVNITAPIKIAGQELSKFTAIVDAELSRVDAITSRNRNAARLYSAEIEGENARVKSEVSMYKSDVDAFESIVDRDKVAAEAINESNKTTVKIFKAEVEASKDITEALVKLDKNRIDVFTIASKKAEALGMAGAEHGQIQASSFSATMSATATSARTAAEITNINASITGAADRQKVAVSRSTTMQNVANLARQSMASVAQLQIDAQNSAAMIGIRSFSSTDTTSDSRTEARDNYSNGVSVTRTTVHSE